MGVLMPNSSQANGTASAGRKDARKDDMGVVRRGRTTDPDGL